MEYICFLNTTIHNITIKFPVYCGSQFHWRRKPDKITNLPKVGQTLSHKVVSSIPHHGWESSRP